MLPLPDHASFSALCSTLHIVVVVAAAHSSLLTISPVTNHFHFSACIFSLLLPAPNPKGLAVASCGNSSFHPPSNCVFITLPHLSWLSQRCCPVSQLFLRAPLPPLLHPPASHHCLSSFSLTCFTALSFLIVLPWSSL